MTFLFSRKFVRKYKQLLPKRQLAIDRALTLLSEESEALSLRRHRLKGVLSGYYSVSAGGDLRIVYRMEGEMCLVADMGTHHDLYGS